MTDSMKFGPEWIRNLSSEPFSSRSPSFIPKAQSVEKRILKKVKPKMEFCESMQNQDVIQRYSRDEMFSFFDKTKLNAPKDLKQHENLYIENIQVPLALDKTERKNTNSSDLYSHCNWQSNRTLMRNHRTILNRNSYSANSGGYNNSISHSSTVSGNGHHNNIGTTNRTMRSNYNSHSSNWNGSVANDWIDNTVARSGKYENFGENWRNKSNWRHEHFDHHTNSNVQNKWSRWRSDSENSNDKSRKNHWSSDGNSETGGNKTSLHKSNHLEMESKIPEWATENVTRMNGSFDADGSFHQRTESTSPSPISTDTNNTTNTDDSIIVPETVKNITNTISSDDKLSQINTNTTQSEPLKTAINKQPISVLVSKTTTAEIDHEHRLKEVANELVSTLKLDDNTVTLKSNTFSDFLTFTNPLKSMISTSSTIVTQQNPCLQPTAKLPPPPPNLNIMRPPPQLQPPTNSFLEDKWYYLDPQGDVQGPFSTIEMSDWYRAGYFSLSLHVRRHSDNVFMPLQELVKINPQFPFHQQKLPAAITTAGLPPAFNNSFLAHFSAVAAAMAAVNDISNNTNTLPTAYVTNPSDIIKNDSSKTIVDTYLNNQKKLMEQFTFLQQQAINTPPIFTPMAQNTSLSSTNYLMNLINQPQLPSVFPTMASSNLNPLSFLQTQKDIDLLTALKNSNKISSIPDTGPMTTIDLQEKLPINTIQPKIDTMPNQHLINNSSSVTNNEFLSTSKPFSTFEDEIIPSSSSGIINGLKKKREKRNKNVVKETKLSNIIDYTGTVDMKTTKVKTAFIKEPPIKSKKQKNELNINEKQKIIKPELIKNERIEKIKSKKNLSATIDELMDLKLDSSLINKPKTDKLNENIILNNQSIDTLKKTRGVVWSKVDSTVTSLSEIQKREQQEEKKRKIERKKAEPTRIIEEEKSLGWTKLPLNSNKMAISLKEIQAEEKKIQSQNAKIKQKAAANSAALIASSSNKQGAWASALSAAEFLKWTTLQSTTSTRNDYEAVKPTKKEPLSSHNNLPSGFWSCNTTSLTSSSSLTPSSTIKENGKQQNSLIKTTKVISEVKNNRTEFEEWCIKLLLQVTGNDSKGVDIPELIKILIEVESANDVRDYVVNFFGEKKGINHFISQFLDRKRKILQRRDNSKSYVDDMLAPAQAILPNEIKAKKNKKSMNKIQSTELNVRAVARLNNMKKGHCVWNNEHLSHI